MNCERCGKAVQLRADGKTWQAREGKGHRVTCPRGGPHKVSAVKPDWDSFEGVLDNWTKDVL